MEYGTYSKTVSKMCEVVDFLRAEMFRADEATGFFHADVGRRRAGIF